MTALAASGDDVDFSDDLGEPECDLFCGGDLENPDNGDIQEIKRTVPLVDQSDDDKFGVSVDVDGGNRAAVIAEGEKAGYLVEKLSDGWEVSDKFDSGDDSPSERSVSLDGTTVAVGRPGTYSGEVDIFSKESSTVTISSALDGFGHSVDLSGNQLIVGAPDGDETCCGDALIYERTSEGDWVEEAHLSSNSDNNDFGFSVAINGSFAAIGDPSSGPFGEVGSVALFEDLDGDDDWQLDEVFDHNDGDRHGHDVNFAGDLLTTKLIAGAPMDDSAATDAGIAYVYDYDPVLGTWSLDASLQHSDPQAGDEFGSGVGIGGQVAVVGAPGADVDGTLDAGAMFAFEDGVQKQKVTATDGSQSDKYGSAVAFDGETAIVGAHLDDVDGYVDLGSSYLYE